MSDKEPLADLLSAMGEAPVPPEDPSVAAARRRRVVHHLGGSLREVRAARARSSTRTRVGLGLAAAAAVALLAFGASRLRKEAATEAAVAGHVAETNGLISIRDSKGVSRAVSGPAALAPQDTLLTSDEAHAKLVLESGVAVDADPATSVELETPFDAAKHPDEAVKVARGKIGLRVPKRPEGTSFRVHTPDAEVIVHGTAFTVTVCDGCGNATIKTRVSVTEGLVGVVHDGQETLVHPGETWPSATNAAPAPTSAATAAPLETPSASPAPSAKPAASSPKGAPSAATATSTLAEQNRLYQSALEARRRGDDARAVALLDDLLARYPSSPLTQEARVERLRSLSKLGRSNDAAAEARKYLVDYPDGFAREEAKDRAIPAPSSSAKAKP